jgi:hypothetical protein
MMPAAGHSLLEPENTPQNFVIPDGAADPEPMPMAEAKSIQVQNDSHHQFCKSTREVWVPDIASHFRNDEALGDFATGMEGSEKNCQTHIIRTSNHFPSNSHPKTLPPSSHSGNKPAQSGNHPWKTPFSSKSCAARS